MIEPNRALLQTAHRIGKQVLAEFADRTDKEARFPQESIDAFKKEKLLSAYVPKEYGGMGATITDLSAICHVLGQYCASSAMIFAMHQIQVVCIVRHGELGKGSVWEGYCRDLVENQPLIASITSEVGIGGDARSSIACVVREGETHATVEKNASVISYGEFADEWLLTARRAPEAPANDQVAVLLKRKDTTLEKRGSWDTMGMRGTCSFGFLVKAKVPVSQLLPIPFADIAAQTMVPVSHIFWTHLWAGIATDALSRARVFIQTEARKKLGTMPPGAIRLAEVTSMHQSLRSNIQDALTEYENISGDPEKLSSIGYSIRMNNLKVSTSQMVPNMVIHALMVCGISGYRNDSKSSLGRHLRDSFGAGVMVNNDRLLGTNANLLLVHKPEN